VKKFNGAYFFEVIKNQGVGKTGRTIDIDLRGNTLYT